MKEDIRDELIDLLNNEGLNTINVDVLLDNIFYNNGKNFVLGRLKTMKG